MIDDTHTLDVVYDVDTLRVDADEDRDVLMSDERRESSHGLLHLALEKRTPAHRVLIKLGLLSLYLDLLKLGHFIFFNEKYLHNN